MLEEQSRLFYAGLSQGVRFVSTVWIARIASMSHAAHDTHEHTNDVLTRQQFPSLSAYLYCHHWLSLLRAEAAASVIKIDEDLSPAQKTAFLESAGLCVRGARAQYYSGELWLCWQDSSGRMFKPPGHCVLSRSDPDFDQRPEVIVFTSCVGTAVKVSNLCKVPWDILEGSWRLDIVKDPKQERKIRDALLLFCQQEQNAFQSLLVDTSLSPESKEAVNHVNGKGYSARLCTSVCAQFGLNESQRYAWSLLPSED